MAERAGKAPGLGWIAGLSGPLSVIGGVAAAASAAVYPFGWLSIAARDSALGLPSATASTSAYVRAGYSFLLESTQAAFAAPLTVTSPVIVGFCIVVALCIAVALAGRNPRWQSRPSYRRLHAAAVVIACAASVAVAIANSLGILDIQQARDLLFHDGSTLLQGSRASRAREALLAVPANVASLSVLYGESVRLLAASAVGLVLVVSLSRSAAAGGDSVPLAALAATDVPVTPPPRSRPILLSVVVLAICLLVALQLFLLPSAYGVLLLGRSRCVELRLTDEAAKALTALDPVDPLRKAVLAPTDRPTGFLLTDLSVDANEVQLLHAAADPVMSRFTRSDVIAFTFAGDCGSVLAGRAVFKEVPEKP